MRFAQTAALLTAILTLTAAAQAAPPGSGLGEFLRGVEARMPAYEAVAAVKIKVPAASMELGRSNDVYKCWELQLTGEHGKKARFVLDRMRRVQKALERGKKRLANDMIRYAAAPALNARLRQRITGNTRNLDTLLERYEALLRLGKRTGLLTAVKRGWFTSRMIVSPKIKQNDYTMIYDDSTPECPTRKAGT